MGALSSILVGLGMQVALLMFVGVWAPVVRRSHPLLPFAWFYAFLPSFYIAEPAFSAVFTTFLSLPKLLANMQFTSFFFIVVPDSATSILKFGVSNTFIHVLALCSVTGTVG